MTDELLHPGSGPRRFGDYIISGLLGEGGMARIYAAQEALSGRPVALKVLRSEFARTEQGRRQFLTEMGILANLDDPHIVRCLSCTEIEQQLVMVLEQLDGWTLRQMIESRVALPWTEVVAIASQIARALHTAHTRRPPIVHRDLKPENVMCLRDGRVKVMDFGIAKLLQSMAGATTHPIGTLQYMSPEHIDAQAVDGRSDLFALGVVMWEMLAGQAPFVSESPRVLLDKICTQPAPPLPDHVRQQLPPGLVQLIDRLLEKRPDARPATAGEVLTVLDAIAGGVPIPANNRQREAIISATARPAPGPQLDTIALVESVAKGPLQRQVEAQIDEVAEAVSRFGRATSALFVRVLVGVMIYPAAALVFLGLPFLLTAIDLAVLDLEPPKPDQFTRTSKQFQSVLVELGLLAWLSSLPITLVVFVRACWAHHRQPGRRLLLKPWLLLGTLLVVAWGATALEFGASGHVEPTVHFVAVACVTAWLAISLSWVTGRITSRILRRLEHARTRA